MLAVYLACAISGHANAKSVTLVTPHHGTVVIVWKSKAATVEGLALIEAEVHKTNPALLSALMSCIVPVGTKAIITSIGLVTHDILVTSGEDAGCRGNVPIEFISTQ